MSDDIQVTTMEGAVGYIAETQILLGQDPMMGAIWMDISARGKTPAQAVERLRQLRSETIEEFDEQQRRRRTVRSIGIAGGVADGGNEE